MAIEPQLQSSLDAESLLFLKPMLIVVIGKYLKFPLAYLFEHPEDPELDPERKREWLTPEESKASMPSIWATRLMRDFVQVAEGETQSFDQGPLGHPVSKGTTIVTNLPIALNEIRGEGQHRREGIPTKTTKKLASKELARWAPLLRGAVIMGICKFLDDNLFSSGYQ